MKFVWVSLLACVFCAEASSLDFADPLIGTEGDGSEYGGMQPYTCVPFGSFHAVPMTRTNEIGRLSFNSSDKTLLGIILTRQPAIWMGDWGEVRVEVPPAKIGTLDVKPYLTRVTAGGRTYEYTATAHAAWIRGLDTATVLAFPESGINTNRMDAKYGYPLPNFGGRWYADKSCPGELKLGLSLISVEQAKANLEKEVGSRTFDEVVAGTKAQWEEMFSRVEIEAPDDVKTIFYTGLYHTLLYPRQMDEDGKYYSAFDDKVHSGTRYNCFSLWDTYRAEHPWLTLIAPERVDGMMQSLVDMYKEGGWLPKWPNPSYTGIMVGAPAEIVLQEARTKGFAGFDHDLAKEAIRKNATVPQEHDTERRWEDRGIFGRAPETRAGLTSYLKRGYVACDETEESVSRTQDFSLADRNRNYTNLWCAEEGMFLPRKADGSFVSRKDLKPPYHDYCEQQPETGVWAVPHDPEGLAELMGGKMEAIRRLDGFFDTIFFRPDGRGNGSIHGNETSHHCAYLYNRFGAPEKTQQRVRQILTKCYSTNRKGFDGNEDCGQMSAWYILSSLGFYPLDPASGEYEIGSPLVKSATVKIGAATLRIVVKGYSPDHWRVKRVTFNGRELTNWRLKHSDLATGGELRFEMEEQRKGADKVLRVVPESADQIGPPDFDVFWQQAIDNLEASTPLDLQMTHMPEKSKEGFDYYRFNFATYKRRMWGFMTVPKDASKGPYPFLLHIPGAGPYHSDWWGGNGKWITMMVNVLDFDPNGSEGIKKGYEDMCARLKAQFGYTCSGYLLSGLAASREEAFNYPVILGLNRIANWAWNRPDVDRSQFVVIGGSQGGFLAIALMGLNHKFTRGAPYVPTFGTLLANKAGLARPLDFYPKEKHAAVRAIAPYFDTVYFAARVTTPVRGARGLADPVCPPSSTKAIFDAIASKEKYVIECPGMTHKVFPEVERGLGAWVRSRTLKVNESAVPGDDPSIAVSGEFHDPKALAR